MTSGQAPLRPPAAVMSAERAGCVVPNALAFPRSALREMVRGRWRVEKLRFELDAQGRGEVLYRLRADAWVFHFFLVSVVLPEEQKTDRNFAAGWDAMGVLCQGEWTAGREAMLRREVPKQRAGFADYDTLIYARGNRSARVFDHVVDSLAAGRQPDLGLLAPVGYILRTTAFIGNGQLGTRPFEGLEPDHPLRRPYHAQFCSGFLLREFVFDLVDHIARARSPQAVRLAPSTRRFLGLGNAAATGLGAFVANHPHFMHRWTAACEQALAQARARPDAPGTPAGRRFAQLLDRAILHLEQSARPADGVFMPPQQVAAELARLRTALARSEVPALPAGATGWWGAVCDWADRHLRPEAGELVHALLLELYPDIVETLRDGMHADERFEVDPAMSTAALRATVETDYGWALDGAFAQAAPAYFWYRSTAAPRDVRRALRGRAPELEVENNMDTPRMVQRLHEALCQADPAQNVATLLCERPDLRHATARVQSLAGQGYAELREAWLGAAYRPFAAIRFALSFFGMDKLEAVPPKSVRGTFLQGAPIAEDVALGRDGDWPFPLQPDPAAAPDLALAPLPPSTGGPRDPVPPADDRAQYRLAPSELDRMVGLALQGHGAAYGVAEQAAALARFAQACGEPGVAAVLRHCSQGLAGGAAAADLRVPAPPACAALLDLRGGSVFLAAPAAFDLACAASVRGVAAVAVRAARDPWLARQLALRGAQRARLTLVLWHDAGGAARGGFALAAPGEGGPWFASGSGADLALLRGLPCASLVDAALSAFADADGGFVLACQAAAGPAAGRIRFDDVAAPGLAATAWSADALRGRHTDWLRRGIALARSEFLALTEAGAAALVPQSEEHRVLAPGTDPLKTF